MLESIFGHLLHWALVWASDWKLLADREMVFLNLFVRGLAALAVFALVDAFPATLLLVLLHLILRHILTAIQGARQRDEMAVFLHVLKQQLKPSEPHTSLTNVLASNVQPVDALLHALVKGVRKCGLIAVWAAASVVLQLLGALEAEVVAAAASELRTPKHFGAERACDATRRKFRKVHARFVQVHHHLRRSSHLHMAVLLLRQLTESRHVFSRFSYPPTNETM